MSYTPENIKGTLDEMTEAEKLRANAETERDKAEKERQREQDSLNTAESERVKYEQQRQNNEKKREQAELNRFTAENYRMSAEEERVKAEQLRNSTEQARQTAENQRRKNELERFGSENARFKWEEGRTQAEKQRQTAEEERKQAETKRESAEQLRADAETKRIETDKEIMSTLEYVNAQKYIKENEYKREVRAIEAIKNAPKDPTQDVWLDSTDGEIKSTATTNKLSSRAFRFYYIGKRVIEGSFGNAIDNKWGGNKFVKHLDLSNWDTTMMIDASYFLSTCSSLQSLDTSGWDLSALTNGSNMFSNCSSLQALDFRKSSFHNLTSFNDTFSGCYLLDELWLPLTFDKLTSVALRIPSWGSTDKGLASLRWTFGEGADDRTAKGLQPCTVRLHASVYDRLTDNERAAAAKKGWTITK